MVQSKAATVNEYIASLPPERVDVIKKVRQIILKNLPKGYEEGMQYGMIGYYIPLEKYPTTYNGEALGYIALAAQKNYFSLYLMCVYSDPKILKWFEETYKQSGKKLDMGKSCLRFTKFEDVAWDVVGEAISKVPPADWIKAYEASREGRKS